jgi:cytochrome b561
MIKKRISWSEAVFSLAAILAALITFEVVIGEIPGKYPRIPRTIDRVEHLWYYIIPFALFFVGWIIKGYENRK